MDMRSADELRDRTERAVHAAVDAGRYLGLDVHDPSVLHDAFSVVVHLAPSPVVVRVPQVLPPSLGGEALSRRQQRELDTVAWLASRGVPVVPPSPLVPRRPVARGAFSMTFWTAVDVAADHAAYSPVDAALVVGLHTAMRGYPGEGELQFLAPVNHTVPSLLARLHVSPGLLAPDDLERATREWEALEPVLGSRAGFERRFAGVPLQAVHGDGPVYNAIRTTSGVRFADFEDVCLAPIEWDMAMHAPDHLEAYARESARVGAAPLDPEVLAVMSAARALQMVVTMALAPELPVLADGLQPALDAWRATPFAGSLE